MKDRVRRLFCPKIVSERVPELILHVLGAKVTAVLKPQNIGIIHT